MRLHRKLVAGTAAALLAFGLAACEVDDQALEGLDEIEDPNVEGGDDF